MKKIFYIVLDGLGDLPIKELNDKTPLEAALTPNMDKLAQSGNTGLLHPVEKGLAPESDVAVISLLGYDAHKYYTGRGPLESYAEGLVVNDGDLALRVNFATAEKEGPVIIDRRVGRNLSTKEAGELAKEVNSKVVLSDATFEFKNTIGHRGVLVIRGIRNRLSGWITNPDPAYKKEGVFGVALEKFEKKILEAKPYKGHENDSKAIDAARLLNEFTEKSRKILNEAAINKKRVAEGKLPANIIVSRDAGDRLPKFPPVSENYGVNFGSFVEMPVEKGIALLTGIKIVQVPPKTGDIEKDYNIWAELAADKIKDYDGLYIHIKGPDEPAHDGNFAKKKESIEQIDKFFFKKLLEKIDIKNSIVCVTADHSTPCNMKAHSADPVPLVISGGNIKPDGSMSFSERTAKLGSLGEILGRELMSLLIKLAKS